MGMELLVSSPGAGTEHLQTLCRGNPPPSKTDPISGSGTWRMGCSGEPGFQGLEVLFGCRSPHERGLGGGEASERGSHRTVFPDGPPIDVGEPQDIYTKKHNLEHRPSHTEFCIFLLQFTILSFENIYRKQQQNDYNKHHDESLRPHHLH